MCLTLRAVVLCLSFLTVITGSSKARTAGIVAAELT
jgi:hypothetical protein